MSTQAMKNYTVYYQGLPQGNSLFVAPKSKILRNKRKRSAAACRKCRERKKKCDGKSACSSCARLSIKCIYDRLTCDNIVSEGEINHLTNPPSSSRVSGDGVSFSDDEELQTSLSGQNLEGDKNGNEDLLAQIKALQDEIQLLKRKARYEESSSMRHNESMTQSKQLYNAIAALVNDTGDISYIGPGSVIYKANAIRNLVMQETHNQPQAIQKGDSDHKVENTLCTSPIPKKVCGDIVEGNVSDFESEKNCLDRYFKLFSRRYFIVEDQEVKSLFPLYYADVHSPIVSSRDSFHNNTVSYLILALGSCLDRISKRTNTLSHEHYFEKAIENMSHIDESLSGIDQIRIIMLMALYLFHSYENSNEFALKVWGLCGLASSKVVQIGLHRFEIPTISSAKLYEEKKRLFWSVYNFEKVLCLILGRPSSFQENLIDVPYPLNIGDLSKYTDEELYAFQSHQQYVQSDTKDNRVLFPKKIASTYYLIQLTKVREIEAKIGALQMRSAIPCSISVHQKGGLAQDLNNGFDEIDLELEAWKSMSEKAEGFEKDMRNEDEVPSAFVTILYQRVKMMLSATRIIDRCFEGDSEPANLLFDAREAAIQVCQAYHSLSENENLAYGILTLHTIFLTGMILVYSFVKLQSFPDFSLHREPHIKCIQQYSKLLHSCSQRSKKGASFKTVFDKLLNETCYSMDLKKKQIWEPSNDTARISSPLNGRHARLDITESPHDGSQEILTNLLYDFFEEDLHIQNH